MLAFLTGILLFGFIEARNVIGQNIAEVEGDVKTLSVVSIGQSCTEQPSPGTWGLDRIDQRDSLPYTDPLHSGATYIWGESLGSQTVAYVADTGIDTEHPDFGGRALWGYTAEGITEPETDLNGHGTHCAGIIGSLSYGVAKEVTMVAVKVVNEFGYGSWSGVLDGLSWILQDHTHRSEVSGTLARSVVSLTVAGSGTNEALEDFIQEMFDAGVVVVVVSGSSYADACDFTPSRAPNATTVASSTITDTSTNSNWGTCLDVFAPGVDILSTTPDNSSDAYSGTSMAVSFVVGGVARYQSSLSPAPTPQQVADWLVSTGTKDALSMSPEHETSPNLLLYVDCNN